MMTPEFQGTDRYAIRRRLGSGGMGVVYEAFDRSRGERVALKTLLRADAAAIFRFKREFRTLANLVHPNLVSLYELHADSDQWFFTMELVEGVTFVKYVRPKLNGDGGAAGTRRLDVARLRTSLRQLAEGVQALHDAGIVHCDIKPSNILVTADGRVRLFDFGIASEISAPSRDVTMRTDQFGTPHYMAPEQAAGGLPAMASDWYGVGVVLYEALTGELPYSGDNLSVVLQRLHGDPPPPETLAPDLPPDLSEICRGLMMRHAAERLGGADLLARLGTEAAVIVGTPATPSTTARTVVGRGAHIEALTAAQRDVRGGGTVSMYVHGESGWGKSTIVNWFLDDVATHERTVVLAGRCYERESMPYKAFDGVIDRLTTFLRTLRYERVEALLPRDVLAVARLFPVLRRVDAIANAPLWDVELPDPVEVRRRAIAALRELLARLADRYMLVVFIDDLQWADADSIALLDQLLAPPSAPPLLLVAAFRSEDVDQRPFLKVLLQRADGHACRELAVGPLTDEDARLLVRSLLGSTASDRLVDSIARESGGSPFLVEQLTHFVRESDTSAASAIALREMLDSRLARLPEGARHLLEVLAVARHPIDAATACRAADLEDKGRSLVSVLRSAHMLRSAAGAFEIDVYHDRIRQALASALDEAVIRSIHLRLAAALSERPDSDPATLFEHYLGAGAHDLARTQALAAAERAVTSLAFDRAARFYRHALALQSTGSADAGSLRAKLGDVLANAGRPAEAAEAYLEACEDADHAGALELRRRAAEQLLFGGHNDRGLQAMRELLKAVDMRIPSSQRQTIAALLAGRLRLRLRGYGYRERQTDLPQRDLLRLDTCGACAIGLSLVDPVLAAYFGSRFLLLALAAGEPLRIARALAMEVGFTASRGGLPDRRTEQLLAQSLAMAERVGSARELGLALVTAGSARVLRGQWKKSVELLLRADQLLRERCTGVQWELTTCQSLLLSAHMYLGEITEAAWRLPLMLADAQERGNLYAATEARTRANFCWLALDEADRARQEATEALERWSRHGLHRQHHNALIAHVNIDLYNGDAASARERVEAHWPVVSRTLMMRVQLFRVETEFLRARAALAMAAENPAASETLLRFSETRAAGIAREKMPWADPFVPLVRATVNALRGRKEAAVADLGTAAAGFDAADMGLYAAMTRRRLGQLLGGSKGEGLIQAADAFMISHGVRQPDRLAKVMVPGVWN